MVKWFNVAWNHGTNRRRYDPNGSLFDWETHKFTFHVDQIIPSVSIILNLNCIFFNDRNNLHVPILNDNIWH